MPFVALLTNHVSIVFVHGLTGNRESTWTDKAAKVFWPRDILAKDLTKARIVTFGYDADIIRGLGMTTAGNGTLRDHGKALAEDLAIWRKKTDSVRQGAAQSILVKEIHGSITASLSF